MDYFVIYWIQTSKRGGSMKKIRIGVFGARRGRSMVSYCSISDKARIVAVCDRWTPALDKIRLRFPQEDIAFYEDFDTFLTHDMDAVILANCANEHAPYAIKALRSGKHVFSEVVPVQTMQEAVALIEAAEQSGKVYVYGENYCYMPATMEMRRLYRSGKIGELEYGEGEYIHNCESIWPSITYGEADHWRNRMYANFYCTHSLGPLIYITGLRPLSVTGFESNMNERHMRVGSQGGQFGIEMVTMENGAMVKSIHGDLYKNSVWYCLYGSKGRMETAREDAQVGDVTRLYVNADPYSGAYGQGSFSALDLPVPFSGTAVRSGHGGSDFCSMDHFIRKLQEDPTAETIDVYEAMDMFLPGHFAYRSVLQGGIPMEIPDLRDPEVRDKYRNDTLCTDPRIAGDRLVPPCSLGEVDIHPSVYELMRRQWLAKQKGNPHG